MGLYFKRFEAELMRLKPFIMKCKMYFIYFYRIKSQKQINFSSHPIIQFLGSVDCNQSDIRDIPET